MMIDLVNISSDEDGEQCNGKTSGKRRVCALGSKKDLASKMQNRRRWDDGGKKKHNQLIDAMRALGRTHLPSDMPSTSELDSDTRHYIEDVRTMREEGEEMKESHDLTLSRLHSLMVANRRADNEKTKRDGKKQKMDDGKKHKIDDEKQSKIDEQTRRISFLEKKLSEKEVDLAKAKDSASKQVGLYIQMHPCKELQEEVDQLAGEKREMIEQIVELNDKVNAMEAERAISRPVLQLPITPLNPLILTPLNPLLGPQNLQNPNDISANRNEDLSTFNFNKRPRIDSILPTSSMHKSPHPPPLHQSPSQESILVLHQKIEQGKRESKLRKEKHGPDPYKWPKDVLCQEFNYAVKEWIAANQEIKAITQQMEEGEKALNVKLVERECQLTKLTADNDGLTEKLERCERLITSANTQLNKCKCLEYCSTLERHSLLEKEMKEDIGRLRAQNEQQSVHMAEHVRRVKGAEGAKRDLQTELEKLTKNTKTNEILKETARRAFLRDAATSSSDIPPLPCAQCGVNATKLSQQTSKIVAVLRSKADIGRRCALRRQIIQRQQRWHRRLTARQGRLRGAMEEKEKQMDKKEKEMEEKENTVQQLRGRNEMQAMVIDTVNEENARLMKSLSKIVTIKSVSPVASSKPPMLLPLQDLTQARRRLPDTPPPSEDMKGDHSQCLEDLNMALGQLKGERGRYLEATKSHFGTLERVAEIAKLDGCQGERRRETEIQTHVAFVCKQLESKMKFLASEIGRHEKFRRIMEADDSY